MTAIARRQQHEIHHQDLAGDYIFPNLPGSHLGMDNPALQLVKSIMQVLSLDRNLNLSSRQLRANLLALFDVREFSAAAAFANPSASFVVKNIVCDDCCAVREMDLCRDADVIPPAITDDTGSANNLPKVLPKWRCGTCNAELNRLVIEERLVSRIQALLAQWVTQDLKCVKCKRLRVNEFMEHCACAGEWVGTAVSREEILKRLEVAGNVARWYNLGMLEEVVKESLEGV
jgi:DNA polymerase epsilon subunit 1